LPLPLTTFVVCLAGPRFALVPDWKALGGVTITLTLLALDFGLCAMFVGALTGSRGAATGAATAAAYLISSLAPVVPQLQSIRWISPFSWAIANDQLAQAPSVTDLVALLGLGGALAVATTLTFRRLDIH
jgi:ABC-2 type transport system permease protein